MNMIDRPLMKMQKEPAPFAPPLPPGNSFVRLLTAQVIAKLNDVPIAQVIERMWPSDRLVARAAVAPAMTTVAGWAAELAAKIIADALDAMGPASAGAELLKDSLVLNWNGAGQISAPGFTAAAGNSGFVAEGAPIPVRQLPLAPALLNPYKLATIAVLTREQAESSNAEALIGDALVRSTGLALDAVLFGTGAATAAQPAGIRNGIAASTPSNNSDAFGAFFEDFATLANAVSAVAGNGPIYIVANAGRAAGMSLRYVEGVGNVKVLGSTAVGSDIIAVAPAALAAALSPEPDVETATSATLVMDTAPGAAGTMGPERELFQTDSIAIKVRWPVTWALRSSAAVAWLTPTWK